MAVRKLELTYWETSSGRQYDSEEVANREEEIEAIVRYLERDSCEIYWGSDVSPEDTVTELLAAYTITPKIPTEDLPTTPKEAQL